MNRASSSTTVCNRNANASSSCWAAWALVLNPCLQPSQPAQDQLSKPLQTQTQRHGSCLGALSLSQETEGSQLLKGTDQRFPEGLHGTSSSLHCPFTQGFALHKVKFLPVQTLVLILTVLSLIHSVKFHSSAKANQTGLINEVPMWAGRGSGFMGFAGKMGLMSLALAKKLQHWKSPPTTWECFSYKSIWQLTLGKTWHSE